MQKHMAALSTEMPGIDPEGKYLWTLLMFDDGWEKEVVHTTHYLKDFSGMTSAAVIKGRNQLLELGYLHRQPVFTGKGKSRERLVDPSKSTGKTTSSRKTKQITKQPSNATTARQSLRELPLPRDLQHQPLIDSLLAQDTKARLPRPRVGLKRVHRQGNHPIGYVSRLLLCVLLRYADECGTVRTLGMSDIIRLTGMTEDRVKYQVELLKKAGYMRSSITGLSNGKLFMAAKGVYFLNLKNKYFGDSAYTGRAFVVKFMNPGDVYESKALQIWGEATRLNQTRTRPPKLYAPLTNYYLAPLVLNRLQTGFATSLEYFNFDANKAPHSSQLAYLEQVIQGFASRMLSDDIRSLGDIHAAIHRQPSPNANVLTDFLAKYAAITKKMLFASILNRHYQDSLPADIDEKINGATDILTITALDTALLAYGCIKTCTNKYLPDSRYVIISKPQIRNNKNPILLTIDEVRSISTDPMTSVICLVHSFADRDLPRYTVAKEYASESDISPGDKKDWGLIGAAPD